MATRKNHLRLVTADYVLNPVRTSQELEDETNIAQRHRFSRPPAERPSETTRILSIAVTVGAVIILFAIFLAMVASNG